MASKRIKLAFILGLKTPAIQITRYAQFAEQSGFGGFWIGAPPSFQHAPTILGLAAQATSIIPIGFGLTNPYTRHVTVNAALAAAIDDLSHQRFTLTFGAGSLEALKGIGLGWDRPVLHIKEAIEVCRQLWTGDPVRYEGETIKIEFTQLATPPKRQDIPIFIGCRRPHMTQLAGELANGVIFDNIPPGYVPFAQSQLQIGAERKQRTLHSDNFTTANMCIWSVNKNRAIARQQARDHLPIDLVTISQREIESAGFAPEDFKPILDMIFSSRSDAMKLAATKITDEITEAFTISGTPDDCIERIRKYEKGGIDLLILGLPTRPTLRPWKMYKLIRDEILPHFQE